MASKFFFSLDSIKPYFGGEGGNVTYVTKKEVPGFANISFSCLKIKPKGAGEPVWHPNAHKIGYCIQGRALVTMRTPGSVETFTVKKGEIYFIPQGYVHLVQNIGDEECIINCAMNSDNVEVMQLSKAIYSLSDPVFHSTFNSNSGFADGLKKTKSDQPFKILQQSKIPSNDISSQYKFNIEASPRVIQTKGGYLQLGTKPNLNQLQGLGILGFGLTPGGVVEPHWHTNAGELVYIVKGKTKITVLSPDGNVEVMDVNAGQGAFAPASHFHNIENVGSEDVEVIAYFTHAEPDYIGIGEVIGAYSNEALASVFNVQPNYFDALKKPDGPLVIVPIN